MYMMNVEASIDYVGVEGAISFVSLCAVLVLSFAPVPTDNLTRTNSYKCDRISIEGTSFSTQ